jgi:drug/metabolite transporter (DMT)-like permease
MRPVIGSCSAALLYGLVILSAIAHAVWNALVKSSGKRTLTMVALRTTGMMAGLLALSFVDWPAPESWMWLAVTSVVMFAYYGLLVRSFDVGDMSVVYPLARGHCCLPGDRRVAQGRPGRGRHDVLARHHGAVLRADLMVYVRRHGATGLFAGVVSVVGFGAYLVAARSLPLGPVSALRETSVIFGAVLGTLVLKEGFGPRRIVAALLVTAGIVLLAVLR